MRFLTTAVLALVLVGCLDNLSHDQVRPSHYLSDSTYSKWTIEVHEAVGQSLPSQSVQALSDELRLVVNKPNGIHFANGQPIEARQGIWTTKDLVQLAQRLEKLETSGSMVVTQLLVLDGRYVQENVWGIAIGWDLVVIFADAIRDGCGPIPPCFTTEQNIFTAVLVHEFGHVIGLVDNGIPMGVAREDPEHPGHSTNRGSVMYWAVESSDLLVFFSGGVPMHYDANDRADLCNAGGRC